MSLQNSNINKENVDKFKIEELKQINELLRDQLIIYIQEKENKQINNTTIEYIPLIDKKIQQLLIENIKLKQTITLQKKIYAIEQENSSVIQLSKILIKNITSLNSILLLPIKILQFLRKSTKSKLPSQLTDNNFLNIYNMYKKEGEESIDQLFNFYSLNNHTRAKIYTAIARKLKENNDYTNVVKFAKKAYEIKPEPYRLKWLAFRIYDLGDSITAEILLNLLPVDIKMSEWEQKQKNNINKNCLKQCEEKIKLQLTPTKEQIEFIDNYKKLKKDNSDLYNKIEYLKEELNKKNKENNDIKEQLKKDYSDSYNKIEYYKKELDKKDEENNNIKEKLNRLINKEDKENNETKAQLNKLTNKIIENDKDLLKYQEMITFYKKENDNLLLQNANIINILFQHFKEDKENLANILRIVMTNKYS